MPKFLITVLSSCFSLTTRDLCLLHLWPIIVSVIIEKKPDIWPQALEFGFLL